MHLIHFYNRDMWWRYMFVTNINSSQKLYGKQNKHKKNSNYKEGNIKTKYKIYW